MKNQAHLANASTFAVAFDLGNGEKIFWDREKYHEDYRFEEILASVE